MYDDERYTLRAALRLNPTTRQLKKIINLLRASELDVEEERTALTIHENFVQIRGRIFVNVDDVSITRMSCTQGVIKNLFGRDKEGIAPDPSNSYIIDLGFVKRWVGIGWLDSREARKIDYSKYPIVIR